MMTKEIWKNVWSWIISKNRNLHNTYSNLKRKCYLSTKVVSHCFIGLVRPFLSHKRFSWSAWYQHFGIMKILCQPTTGVVIFVPHFLHLKRTRLRTNSWKFHHISRKRKPERSSACSPRHPRTRSCHSSHHPRCFRAVRSRRCRWLPPCVLSPLPRAEHLARQGGP